MGDSVLYVYLDEAGDFTFAAKGSAHFIMTGVAMTRPFVGHVDLLDIKYDLLEAGLNLDRFHACEDRQAVRNRVFQVISNNLDEYAAYTVVIRKNKTNPALREEKALYGRVFEWLMKYLCRREVGANVSQVVVVTDRLPVQHKAGALKQAVKQNLKRCLPDGLQYNIYHHDSRSDLNLQVADYFSWAIQRKWEKDDQRSYNTIRAAVWGEGDLFKHGDEVYYEK